MHRILSLLFVLSTPIVTLAGELRTFEISVKQTPEWLYSSKIRVGIQNPEGAPLGDVLYFHGFSDRLDNHGPLFEAWNKEGLRVISFDCPSHGDSTGTSLNFFSFRRLARLAVAVEKATREETERPLILSGWSTGGLLALRMMQGRSFEKFERSPRGLILFAPGVSVRNFVGEPSLRYPLGEVTLESLTHDPFPPHRGEISPKSPGSTLIFASFLKLNSLLSQFQNLPPNLPSLILLAGSEDDRYANSEKVLNWIQKQNENGAQIDAFAFPGARHEIDNETELFGGPLSRKMAAKFARVLVRKSIKDCRDSLANPRP